MPKKLYALEFLICGIFLLFLLTGCTKHKPTPAAARNAHDFLVKVISPETDLATRVALFPNILYYDYYTEPRSSPGLRPSISFLDTQIAMKIFRVEAVFLMLQGEREDALKLLATCYHLGQLMNQSDTIISRLVGIALRAIACGGLKTYALNCCEIDDDFKHLWKTLEQLNGRSQDASVLELLSLEPLSLSAIKETRIRHRCADAKFQLVRMATAAKYRFVTQQAFPRSPDEFAPLLLAGPPRDPFGSGPLKFFSGSYSFTCYSIGPNEKDDRAAVSYDPTNGTVSGGDIFVEIPHEREYPFPRDGVKAASADELRRLFPNGLPADIFAHTRGRPLGISNTTPVYVYSYGPDIDESEARKVGDRYVPEALYDPTNGTISPGDLFIAIPLGL